MVERDLKETGLSNPYVGPRTFLYKDRKFYFGRDNEARELFYRVTANRLVLFYAQSASGKSSLVNVRLIPDLAANGFEVLPVGRVGGEEWTDKERTDLNPFVSNLIQSMLPEGTDLAGLQDLTLSKFLLGLECDEEGCRYIPELESADEPAGDLNAESWPRALIIDQFEEILTTNMPFWKERERFFRQLKTAMDEDPDLWVVLIMREDFVAGLDPYAHLLPGRLQTRYYMERLKQDAALEAIVRPAVEANRSFEEGAAEELLKRLSEVRSPVLGRPYPGQYVEPVQLQVVCFQLWSNVAEEQHSITEADVEKWGDVDVALEIYYNQAIREVLASPDRRESKAVGPARLRRWIEEKLITSNDTRAIVLQGESLTEGMHNEIVDLLEAKYILRKELRGGGTYVELIHDRFIEPIKSSNKRWNLGRSPELSIIETAVTSISPRDLNSRNPELYQAWAQSLQVGYQNNDWLFKQVLKGTQAVFQVNLILYVVLYVAGIVSLIVALILVFFKDALVSGLIFGLLSIIIFMLNLLSRTTDKFREDMEYLTTLSLMYSAYWTRVNTTFSPAQFQGDIEAATDDVLRQLRQTGSDSESAVLENIQQWVKEQDNDLANFES